MKSIRTTPTILVFLVQCSEAQAKFPESNLKALYLTVESLYMFNEKL